MILSTWPFPPFCIVLYKSQKWDFWVKDMNIILYLPNCLPERLYQFTSSFSSVVNTNFCRTLPTSAITRFISSLINGWKIVFILLCISLITGKVEHLSVFYNSFMPIVYSYALSIYFLVGDFSVFLTNLYDKGEGNSVQLKLWPVVLFTSSIWSFRSWKD